MKKCYATAAIVIFLFSTFPLCASAESECVAKTSGSAPIGQDNSLSVEIERLSNVCKRYVQDISKLLEANKNSSPIITKQNEEIASARHAVWIEYYKYRESRYQFLTRLQRHADDIFNWQSTTIRLVTFFTMLIMVAGLVVAAREIPRTLLGGVHVSNSSAQDGDGDINSRPKHEILIQPGSISVTTAAAWVVMMALGLGYFYLFTTEVMRLDPMDFGLPASSSDGRDNTSQPLNPADENPQVPAEAAG